MLNKIKSWIKRYLPAEIFALFGAMIGGLSMDFLFHNQILTALGGSTGENLGYYGKIIVGEVIERRKQDKQITLKGLFKIIRNIFIEFGFSEYFDSVVFRPGAMFFWSQVLNNIPLGLFLGKITADITFYIPTIFFLELRKKYLKD